VEGVAAQQRKMGRETIAKAFLEYKSLSFSLGPSVSIPNQTVTYSPPPCTKNIVKLSTFSLTPPPPLFLGLYCLPI
jgi:hypothetical protein